MGYLSDFSKLFHSLIFSFSGNHDLSCMSIPHFYIDFLNISSGEPCFEVMEYRSELIGRVQEDKEKTIEGHRGH